MATSTAQTEPSRRRFDRSEVVGLLRGALLAVLVLLLAFALLLATRRLSGALRTPLSTAALLALGGLLALFAGGLRGAWQGVARSTATWGDRLMRYGPSVALWTTVGCVSLAGSPLLGLALCWLLIIAAELWHWKPWSRALPSRPASPRSRPAADDSGTLRLDTPSELAKAGRYDLEDLAEEDDLPANVVQRLTRARDASGTDVLDGSLRADLAADQRTTSVHVAFCPPFASSPEVSVEQTAGPDATIKVAQVLPYGTRLEVRLARLPQQPSTVTLAINCRAAVDSGSLV
jgi:hypothetical protein